MQNTSLLNTTTRVFFLTRKLLLICFGSKKLSTSRATQRYYELYFPGYSLYTNKLKLL
jgi:hypothetical protein